LVFTVSRALARLNDNNLPKQICLSDTPEITGRTRTFAPYFAISFPCIHTYIHTYIFDEAGLRLATQRAGVDLP